MIARIWHGAVAREKPDEYLDYLNRTGVPDFRATKGNLGVCVLRRTEDRRTEDRRTEEDRAHFLTVSFWGSMGKDEAFAGSDPETARFYSEDGEFLLDFGPTVRHYEVAVEAQAQRGLPD